MVKNMSNKQVQMVQIHQILKEVGYLAFNISYKNMKIAFDLGGVLSKHQEIRDLYIALYYHSDDVYIISDISPLDKLLDILTLNKIPWYNHQVLSADYKKYGENCKKVLCEKMGIDILIDDHMGYLVQGNYVRLLVMPDASKAYFSDDWKTDGTEGDFGRTKS